MEDKKTWDKRMCDWLSEMVELSIASSTASEFLFVGSKYLSDGLIIEHSEAFLGVTGNGKYPVTFFLDSMLDHPLCAKPGQFPHLPQI